jgi:hypothetical protein
VTFILCFHFCWMNENHFIFKFLIFDFFPLKNGPSSNVKTLWATNRCDDGSCIIHSIHSYLIFNLYIDKLESFLVNNGLYISKLQWVCFIYMMKWFCLKYCNNFSIFYIIYTWIFKNGRNLQWTCHGMAIIFQMEFFLQFTFLKGMLEILSLYN